MSDGFSTSGAHVLMFPYPTSGHIIPLLDLTHQLLTRGLTITFWSLLSISLYSNHFYLSTLSLFARCSSPYQIHPLPHVKDIWLTYAPPLNFTILFFSGSNPTLRHLSPSSLIFSSAGLNSSPASLASHVSCSQLRVPWIYVFLIRCGVSNPRTVIPRMIICWCRFLKFRILRFFIGTSFPMCIVTLRKETQNRNFTGIASWINMASWGLVFNSFTELERVYIDYMRKELGHDRVWAVGPLLPPHDDTQRGGSTSVQSHEMLTWLDQRPDHSVVYVCFGSRAKLTHRQMKVLSDALECSGITFILCVREGSDRHVASDYGVISDEYEDRVKGRGFVIRGWAPQVAILRHRAVGSFLTHCGWNSVLEGLSAGVVILTWPMDADQFSNAKLLVDELGVGVRVGEASQKIPDSDELAQLLAESVGESRPERVRAIELSAAALGSVKGGNSERDLDELVKRLSEVKCQKGTVNSHAEEVSGSPNEM